MEAQAVLITGGTRGIGYATAQAFLEQGAHVAICGTSPENLETAAHALEVLAVRADVRDPQQVRSFVQQARERFGRIDALVNNAGVAWSGDFADEAYESIARQIDVNVKGVLYTARAVLPYLLEQGAGVIINIASGAGLTAFAGITTTRQPNSPSSASPRRSTRKSATAASASTAFAPAASRPTCSRPTPAARSACRPSRWRNGSRSLAGPKPRARTGSCVTLG